MQEADVLNLQHFKLMCIAYMLSVSMYNVLEYDAKRYQVTSTARFDQHSHLQCIGAAFLIDRRGRVCHVILGLKWPNLAGSDNPALGGYVAGAELCNQGIQQAILHQFNNITGQISDLYLQVCILL